MENSGYYHRDYDYRNDRNRRCKISNRVEWEVILVSVSPTAPAGCFGEHKGGIKRCHAIAQGFPGKGDIRGFANKRLCIDKTKRHALLHSLYETVLYQYLGLLHLLTGIDLERIIPELFGQLLYLMLQSKACCHLENEQKWNWTRINLLEKKREYVCKTTALKTRKTTLDNEEKNLK